MTQRDAKQLLEMASNFRNEAKQRLSWNELNSHRCGHSNDKNALGDEGWHRLFENNGYANAYQEAANKIEALILTKCPELQELAERWRSRDGV